MGDAKDKGIMLDVLRHRVLRALGELDLDKSWTWIEHRVRSLAAKSRELAPRQGPPRFDDLPPRVRSEAVREIREALERLDAKVQQLRHLDRGKG